MIKPESLDKPIKSIKSFVLRTGRMTHGQKAAFERHWDIYGLRISNGRLDTESIFNRRAPVVLEIGFGMGDSLLEMCQNEPDKDFIGVEVHKPGVGRLINLATEASIKNLRVYMADVNDVLTDCIAMNSLSRIQVYFPDPWHKKKHHKRRLIQPAFIDQLIGFLAQDGLLHLATDWQPYAEHMLEVFEGASALANLAGEGASDRPEWRPKTKFELRGENRGHGVWDFLYRKTS